MERRKVADTEKDVLGRRKKLSRRRDRRENDDGVAIEMMKLIVICDRGGYKKEEKNMNNDNEKGVYGVENKAQKRQTFRYSSQLTTLMSTEDESPPIKKYELDSTSQAVHKENGTGEENEILILRLTHFRENEEYKIISLFTSDINNQQLDVIHCKLKL